MFEQLEQLPSDPILGLSALCKADPNPNRVDLTVGVYMDEQGVTPVFEAIRLAQQQLVQEEITKVYMAPVGDADFNSGMRKLLLGEDSAALAEDRVMSIQTPGGCGALRLGAELIKAANADARIWVSTPTWANHVPLLGSAGLDIKEYRYYAAATHSVDFEGMLADLGEAKKGDVVLLHGCCHNPCGADLSQEQWRAIAALAQEIGFTPFVDIAYQGLGDGLEEDAYGLRQLVGAVPEVLVAASCSKNMGLYRERVGASVIIAGSAARAQAIQSQGAAIARKSYSMPPAHGSILAGKVLNNADLNQIWRHELDEMCQRINDLRALLVKKLGTATGQDFSFIQHERGMFSFLGLSEAQVVRLREEHSVYMIGSSRINIAGVSNSNIDYFAEAVAKVL
jgi:aspartate aminotransferase